MGAGVIIEVCCLYSCQYESREISGIYSFNFHYCWQTMKSAVDPYQAVIDISNHLGPAKLILKYVYQLFSKTTTYSQQLKIHFYQRFSKAVTFFMLMSKNWSPATSHLFWPCRVARTHCSTHVRIWEFATKWPQFLGYWRAILTGTHVIKIFFYRD